MSNETEQRLYELMQQVASEQARTNQRLEHVEKQLTDISYSINGNGKPGLRMDVDRLQQRQRREDKRKEKFWSRSKVAMKAISIIVPILIALVSYYYGIM